MRGMSNSGHAGPIVAVRQTATAGRGRCDTATQRDGAGAEPGAGR